MFLIKFLASKVFIEIICKRHMHDITAIMKNPEVKFFL